MSGIRTFTHDEFKQMVKQGYEFQVLQYGRNGYFTVTATRGKNHQPLLGEDLENNGIRYLSKIHGLQGNGTCRTSQASIALFLTVHPIINTFRACGVMTFQVLLSDLGEMPAGLEKKPGHFTGVNADKASK